MPQFWSMSERRMNWWAGAPQSQKRFHMQSPTPAPLSLDQRPRAKSSFKQPKAASRQSLGSGGHL